MIDHGFVDAFCFTCAIYIVHVYAKDKLEKFLRTVCKVNFFYSFCNVFLQIFNFFCVALLHIWTLLTSIHVKCASIVFI